MKDIINSIIKNYHTHNPYIIGITGAMGVGKSTFTCYLKNYLQNILEKNIIISSINTDSFLYDNDILEKENIMGEKGFPKSFNQKLFYEFLVNIKQNIQNVYQLPIYSQIIKNIDKNSTYLISKSDIYLLEGINLFYPYKNSYPYKLLDMLILLDMKQSDIKKQCIKRFNIALDQHKKKPSDYFKKLQLDNKHDITKYQNKLWQSINKPFYEIYIKPNIKYATHILKVKHKKQEEGFDYFD